MEFFQPYINMFKNYATFSGRTRRKDFWMAVLVNFLISLILSILTGIASFFGIIQMIYSLAILIPFLAMWARRLHDTSKSAWFLLLALIPRHRCDHSSDFCLHGQPARRKPVWSQPEGNVMLHT